MEVGGNFLHCKLTLLNDNASLRQGNGNVDT